MPAATLLELAGADLTPAKIADAALILIDMQNEYRAGPVAVTGFEPAVAAAANLLAAARKSGSPVFHIAQKGRAGGLFDRAAERGQITAELTPQPGEPVIEKPLPNAFAGTELAALVAETGRKNLIVVGFMTHMCVSSTTRAALDLGYRVTIDAGACATRDLPDGRGGVIAAGVLHDIALAELADRFAIVARESGALL
ncbi:MULTISPECIES: cysteine hydrolase family protein [Rhodomicrobium]|uniref:cysteine hydrolase family protein n=1 Tax=Rhodomicrobium TaxID=1068 RepID=UPI000B4B55C2|nr:MULTISPECIES: cysteine hydrolase family protein [Rhodomicrobium]